MFLIVCRARASERGARVERSEARRRRHAASRVRRSGGRRGCDRRARASHVVSHCGRSSFAARSSDDDLKRRSRRRSCAVVEDNITTSQRRHTRPSARKPSSSHAAQDVRVSRAARASSAARVSRHAHVLRCAAARVGRLALARVVRSVVSTASVNSEKLSIPSPSLSHTCRRRRRQRVPRGSTVVVATRRRERVVFARSSWPLWATRVCVRAVEAVEVRRQRDDAAAAAVTVEFGW